MGTWIRVPKRARIAERNPTGGNAEAAVLLLRAGVQEQHKPPARQAPEGLPNPPDALQAQARREALRVQEMREELRSERRLADAREELREAVVLHVRIGFQAQEVSQGPHQVLREWPLASPFPRRLRSRRQGLCHGRFRGRRACST